MKRSIQKILPQFFNGGLSLAEVDRFVMNAENEHFQTDYPVQVVWIDNHYEHIKVHMKALLYRGRVKAFKHITLHLACMWGN